MRHAPGPSWGSLQLVPQNPGLDVRAPTSLLRKWREGRAGLRARNGKKAGEGTYF